MASVSIFPDRAHAISGIFFAVRKRVTVLKSSTPGVSIREW